MSATIEVAGATATLEGDTWECEDAAVARELNLVSDSVQVPACDPHPLQTRAAKVADVFGGRLIKCSPPDAIEDGLIY